MAEANLGGLSVMSWNVGGLFRERTPKQYVVDYINREKFDIVFIQETMSKEDEDIDIFLMYIDVQYELDVQYAHYSSHVNRSKHGVSVFVKQGLVEKVDQDNVTTNITNVALVPLKGYKPGRDLLLVCVYLPPTEKTETFTALKNSLEQIFDDNRLDKQITDILLAGDLNMKCVGIVDTGQGIESNKHSGYDNKLWASCLDLCVQFELKILNAPSCDVGKPGTITCFNSNGNSVVDYMMVSGSMYAASIPYFKVLKTDAEDIYRNEVPGKRHRPLECKIPTNNEGASSHPRRTSPRRTPKDRPDPPNDLEIPGILHLESVPITDATDPEKARIITRAREEARSRGPPEVNFSFGPNTLSVKESVRLMDKTVYGIRKTWSSVPITAATSGAPQIPFKIKPNTLTVEGSVRLLDEDEDDEEDDNAEEEKDDDDDGEDDNDDELEEYYEKYNDDEEDKNDDEEDEDDVYDEDVDNDEEE